MAPMKRAAFWTLLAISALALVAILNIGPKVAHGWLIGHVVDGLLFVAVLVPLWSAFSNHQLRAVLAKWQLHIDGDFFHPKVSYSNLKLDGACVVDLVSKPSVGPGFSFFAVCPPGYASGWFWRPCKGRVLVLLTERRAAVHIPTRLGYDLLFSPANPSAFLDALRKKAAEAASANVA